MSVIEVMFNQRFILACIIYAAMIITGIPLLEWLSHKLNHHILVTVWMSVIEPLYRAFVLVVFIFIAYPVIFGLSETAGIFILLSEGEQRTDQLMNLIFLTSLLLPLLPVIGKLIELVLPVQAILCCMMVFSWLAQHLGMSTYSYWPGITSVLVIILLAICTHWLSITLAKNAGTWLDEHYNVTGFEEITGQAIILFMQAPAILVYSLGLGMQLG